MSFLGVPPIRNCLSSHLSLLFVCVFTHRLEGLPVLNNASEQNTCNNEVICLELVAWFMT